jgi:15-cis-phytoene synthase
MSSPATSRAHAVTNAGETLADGLASAYDTCEQIVRRHDLDRYYATMFAPVAARPALFALYAFNQDIAQVRERVSDALPGEMRLQWWRDALNGVEHGAAAGHPVALALSNVIRRYRLPVAALLDLIEARVFDLYDDPMPDEATLEGYAGETSSSLIRLASLILSEGEDRGGAEAAGHAGVAYAAIGLVRAFPWHAQRGQVFVPMTYLARHGATREDVVTGRGGPGVVRALADVAMLAQRHLAETRRLAPGLDPTIAPAFLPVALVDPHLRRLNQRDYDPYRSRIDLPAWRKIWVLWQQSRRAMR